MEPLALGRCRRLSSAEAEPREGKGGCAAGCPPLYTCSPGTVVYPLPVSIHVYTAHCNAFGPTEKGASRTSPDQLATGRPVLS